MHCCSDMLCWHTLQIKRVGYFCFVSGDGGHARAPRGDNEVGIVYLSQCHAAVHGIEVMISDVACAGFGSRMLAKYGFEGQGAGLGRNSQGRAEPISAVMRPKNLGLGAAGKKGQ